MIVHTNSPRGKRRWGKRRCTHHHPDLPVAKLPGLWRHGTPCERAEIAAMLAAMDAAHEYEVAKEHGRDVLIERLKLTIAELEQENLELRHRLAEAGVDA